jgi:hypothetical protein
VASPALPYSSLPPEGGNTKQTKNNLFISWRTQEFSLPFIIIILIISGLQNVGEDIEHGPCGVGGCLGEPTTGKAQKRGGRQAARGGTG